MLESFNCFTRDTLFPSAGEWLPTPSKEILTRLLTQLPKIQQIELYLERKAKAEVTIQTYVKALKEIAKRADLNNPVEVELAISRYKKKDGEPCSNRWKNQCCDSYFHYCKVNNIQWERVHYQIDERSIQPPSPEKCLMLMTRASGQLSLKIDISIQTGLRPVEVTGIEKGLRVRDIHFDTKTITPTSAKGCNARPPIPITAELCARIQTHILKHNLAFNDRLFKEKSKSYGDSFRKMKNRLAIKLCDPSIKGIRLYDIRHAYITKMLRKIQNPEMVSIKVGHKRLNTTQKYFHLLADQSGELIVARARAPHSVNIKPSGQIQRQNTPSWVLGIDSYPAPVFWSKVCFPRKQNLAGSQYPIRPPLQGFGDLFQRLFAPCHRHHNPKLRRKV